MEELLSKLLGYQGYSLTSTNNAPLGAANQELTFEKPYNILTARIYRGRCDLYINDKFFSESDIFRIESLLKHLKDYEQQPVSISDADRLFAILKLSKSSEFDFTITIDSIEPLLISLYDKLASGNKINLINSKPPIYSIGEIRSYPLCNFTDEQIMEVINKNKESKKESKNA